MGRELKRVALDFDAPLNKVWAGYINPHYRSCGACRDGYSPTYTYVAKHINALMWDRVLHATPDGLAIQEALAGRPASFMGHDSCDAYAAVAKLGELAGLPESWLTCAVCAGSGTDPAVKDAYEAWEPTEPPIGNGYQVWETVSEGSPISPVFATPEELATWMCREHARDGNYEQWLTFITGPGWAPSLIMDARGARSGVQA
jgi:hypothetical protein